MYLVNGNEITVNGKTTSFMYDIHPTETVQIADKLIVLLDPPPGQMAMDNVYAISDSGDLLWQIESRRLPVNSAQTYVHIYIDPAEHSNENTMTVGATTFGGDACSIDINTGKILSTRFVK
ncbi:hypothetical protein Pla110_44890 [Polystyrenella longa]|uniref:Uncharacterized protein n=1 Tax=Polystyrenella longa TaxID=2528007 RepID=A0A518CU27_9PLAN|nr:hypothetical protein [Polystyrenella longa]QDU82727.1 hypothetical protein Pla110_44890 [Polystyrenella longa]